ncbi:MAG: hypothetical protein KatS3mg111_1254 [Pirellulaceae bacterium]|nr:MAG: hypothetical protein KatS3mg111_1254 [Pirellulaceae bacterium]
MKYDPRGENNTSGADSGVTGSQLAGPLGRRRRVGDRMMIPTEDETLHWLITDDGSRTLIDDAVDQSYHSASGAIAESLHVYLRNSQALRRLGNGQPTRLLEVGFGTGTNMILTAAMARARSTPLEYVGLDQRWLPPSLLSQLDWGQATDKALAMHPELAADLPPHFPLEVARVQEQFLRHWSAGWSHSVAENRRELGVRPGLPAAATALLAGDSLPEASSVVSLHIPVSHRVQVTVLRMDVATLGASRNLPSELFDGIYFDPFSPDKNPDVWTTDVLRAMRRLVTSTGRLTSYCVRRTVRDALRDVGFSPQCVPGPPGGKRQVLLAIPTIGLLP